MPPPPALGKGINYIKPPKHSHLVPGSPLCPTPSCVLAGAWPSISLGEAISLFLCCGDIFLSQGLSSASTAPGEVPGCHKNFYCDYVGVRVSIWVIAHLV